MTNLYLTLWDLPTNSKRILIYLEYEAHALPDGEVTIATLSKKLGLTRSQVKYAVGNLRIHRLVNTTSGVGGKMHTKQLSVNSETVERSDIKEMIHNV